MPMLYLTDPEVLAVYAALDLRIMELERLLDEEEQQSLRAPPPGKLQAELAALRPLRDRCREQWEKAISR